MTANELAEQARLEYARAIEKYDSTYDSFVKDALKELSDAVGTAVADLTEAREKFPRQLKDMAANPAWKARGAEVTKAQGWCAAKRREYDAALSAKGCIIEGVHFKSPRRFEHGVFVGEPDDSGCPYGPPGLYAQIPVYRGHGRTAWVWMRFTTEKTLREFIDAEKENPNSSVCRPFAKYFTAEPVDYDYEQSIRSLSPEEFGFVRIYDAGVQTGRHAKAGTFKEINSLEELIEAVEG